MDFPARPLSLVRSSPTELAQIARGWLEVPRLAERLRRRRQGRPVLELVETDEDAGAGGCRCGPSAAPGDRAPRPALTVLAREDSNDPG